MTTPDVERTLLEGTVRAIGGAYRKRELSIRESVSWFLSRIDTFNQKGPALNAVKDVSSHALEDARALDE